MRKIALAAVLLAALAVMPLRPATAATWTQTLGVVATAVAGAAVGIAAYPYVAPVVTPAAAATYATASAALGSAAQRTGTWLASDPHIAGAVVGGLAGLFVGMGLFVGR